MQPQTIYFDQNAMITSRAAQIFGATYPIAAITSLNVSTIDRSEPGKKAALALFGGFAFLAGGAFLAVALIDKHSTHNAEGFQVFFGGLTALGLLALLKVFRAKPKAPHYSLNITTASGEREAVVSPDRTYVDHIRAAIEHAIHLRV